MLRVNDLAEFADTLELFAIGRRVRAGLGRSGAGIATVHDSGLERAHVVDVAEAVGVPFAEIGAATVWSGSATCSIPASIPANPLDVWGTGADDRGLFGGSLLALAADPAVQAVALAVDFVHELDGDQSYPLAMLDVAERTDKPLGVLSNLSSAIDLDVARQLRAAGVPVLEGTRSGLLALRHLLDHARQAELDGSGTDEPRGDGGIRPDRQARGVALLASGQASGAALLELLAEYGISVAAARPAADVAAVTAAAEELGYPVVLKTDEPQIQHKSDVGGVVLGIGDVEAARGRLHRPGGPPRPAGARLSINTAWRGTGPRDRRGSRTWSARRRRGRRSARRAAGGPAGCAAAGVAGLAADLLADLRVRALLDGSAGSGPPTWTPSSGRSAAYRSWRWSLGPARGP